MFFYLDVFLKSRAWRKFGNLDSCCCVTHSIHYVNSLSCANSVVNQSTRPFCVSLCPSSLEVLGLPLNIETYKVNSKFPTLSLLTSKLNFPFQSWPLSSLEFVFTGIRYVHIRHICYLLHSKLILGLGVYINMDRYVREWTDMCMDRQMHTWMPAWPGRWADRWREGQMLARQVLSYLLWLNDVTLFRRWHCRAVPKTLSYSFGSQCAVP